MRQPYQELPPDRIRFARSFWFLITCGVLCLTLLATACQRIQPPTARPPARWVGTLWWMSPGDLNRPIAAWQRELDELQALGIRLLVLNGPYVGESPPEGTAGPLESFLAETDRRGLSVYLDTLAAPNWWTLPDPTPEIARARTRIETLANHYGHHPSFTGWYLPYELYVMWGAPAELIADLYREISLACKQVSPDRRVMISPFFLLDQSGQLGSFRWATPGEYQEFWTRLLEPTRIDIVALQDSGEHLSCYSLEQRRPFLAAMQAACATTRRQFWINVEVGELEVASLTDYTNRFGYQTHVNDPRTATAWRAVPPAKLREKLELAGEYSDTAISWGYQQFIRPSLGPEAKHIYDSYRTLLRDLRSDRDAH